MIYKSIVLILLVGTAHADKKDTDYGSITTAYSAGGLATLVRPFTYTIDEIDISIMGDRQLFEAYNDTKQGNFYHRNYKAIKANAAKGNGEFLDEFSKLLLGSDEKEKRFKMTVRQNFSHYFSKKIPTFSGFKKILTLKQDLEQ